MLFLYQILVALAALVLPFLALFSSKLALFVSGRKNVFPLLENQLKPNDKTIWFHAASLGEYEQGVPLIEKIKEKYPTHKIVLSFFSPSGYEIRKNNALADVTVYLPLDTLKNARKFIGLVHPEMVFFIKYEFWPNYLNELKKQAIPTYLISGIFRKNQVFFKWYGRFYTQALNAFQLFFVQNETSKKLLNQLGKKNVILSGDTRFDRVASILEQAATLDYIEAFKEGKTTLVAGSTWPKDETLLLELIQKTKTEMKFIIAPHNIKAEQIQQLKNNCPEKTLLFSEKEGKNPADYKVFIIDTIGLLTQIYRYADIAYVGGGFGHPGIHNILEPATYGIPICIGPNYAHFAEAEALVELNGCFSIDTFEALDAKVTALASNELMRKSVGKIAGDYVQKNRGAVQTIMQNLN